MDTLEKLTSEICERYLEKCTDIELPTAEVEAPEEDFEPRI